MTGTGLPNPIQGYCPNCGGQRIFVPLYTRTKEEENLDWACVACGHRPPKAVQTVKQGSHPKVLVGGR